MQRSRTADGVVLVVVVVVVVAAAAAAAAADVAPRNGWWRWRRWSLWSCARMSSRHACSGVRWLAQSPTTPCRRCGCEPGARGIHLPPKQHEDAW